MTALLALFVRSLRADVRSKSLLWTRIALVVGIVFSFWRAGERGRAAPGLDFFTLLVWMNFICIGVAGLSYFASAITEEKEDATLSLLRMTDLSPFSILLGKSTSRLCGGLVLLLVQVPFALLAVTLGGVHLLQILKAYALLASFLFFACNAGLLGSVFGSRTGEAGLLTAILGAVCWFIFDAANLPALFRSLLALGGQHTPIGGSCRLAFFLGIAAFLVARAAFERYSGEQLAPTANSRSRLARLAAKLLRSTPGRAWGDAVVWRDFYFLHGGKKLLALKAVAYAAFAGILYYEYSGRTRFSALNFLSILCYWAIAAFVAESLFSASRVFRREHQDHTLSALILLPGEPKDLVRAKRRALYLSLIPLFAAIAFTIVPLLFNMVQTDDGWDIFINLVGGVLLFVEFIFHCYLVGWFSLRLRWGALPVCLALSVVANAFLGLLLLAIFQEASLFFMLVLFLAFFRPLRHAFFHRLAAAAEED
jgi:ABC-type transport system involved in cytochrome c biogenesis permease component